MKKLLLITFMLLAFCGFSQKHKTYFDKIILNKGDTINCIVTLVNDNNIFFYSEKNDDDKIYYKPVTEVRKYILSIYSNPEVITSAKKDSTLLVLKSDPISINEINLSNNTAGFHLIKASNNANASMILSILGVVVSSIAIIDYNNAPAYWGVGAGINVISIILHFTAWSHINKAGEHLLDK